MLLKKIVRSPLFFVVLSLIILFLGYSQNMWRATDYNAYFDYMYYQLDELDDPVLKSLTESYPVFDRYSESLVLGRLVKTRKDGILSAGGFTGNFLNYPPPPANVHPLLYKHAYQYKSYLDDSLDNKIKRYDTYRSQFGGQALILSILDKFIPGNNNFKLKFFYNFMALLTTLAVFLVIFWFYKEFGVFTGWVLVVCFTLFSYPTLYANNLWWVPWAFYIPFLLTIYAFYKEDISGHKLSYPLIFLLGFLGIFIKIFFNGFEFITPILIMITIPVFYYAIKNKWGVRNLTYRLIALGGGVVLSFLLSIALLSFQFILAGDTFTDGLYHIYDRLLRQTHANPFINPSQDIPLYELIKYYVMHPQVFDFRKMGTDFQMFVIDFLVVFSGASLIWFLFIRIIKVKERYREICALNYTLWISLLAPLSWLVLFKGHIYFHRQHDPIIWYMPYMFYGVGLVGVTVEVYLKYIINLIKRSG